MKTKNPSQFPTALAVLLAALTGFFLVNSAPAQNGGPVQEQLRELEVIPNDENLESPVIPPSYEPDIFGTNKKEPESQSELDRILARADMLYGQGKLKQAKQAYVEASQQDGKSVRAATGLAYTYDFLGELDSALMAYQHLLKLDPNAPEMRVNVAHVQIARDKLANAEELLKQELKNNPNSARANSVMGMLYLEKEKRDRAITYFQRAGKTLPSISQYHYERGKSYQGRKQPRRALLEFQATAYTSDMYPDAYFELGVCYAELGFPKPAVQAYERFLQLAPVSLRADRAKREIQRLENRTR